MTNSSVRFTADGRMVEATPEDVLQSIMDEFKLDRKTAELFSDLGQKSTQDVMDVTLDNLKTFCDVGGLPGELGLIGTVTALSGSIKHIVTMMDEVNGDEDGEFKKWVRTQVVLLTQVLDVMIGDEAPVSKATTNGDGNGW